MICGSKKKQDAKGRLKAGRKRLADVIAELQTSATLDAGLLRRRLEEVLCPPASAAVLLYLLLLCLVEQMLLMRLHTRCMVHAQVDSALGGMEEPCPSSSSSSSSDEEDEMMQGRTAVATASPAAEPEMAPRSNAVPMQLAGKAKAVVPACVVSTTELNALVASLAPDSVVRVCQGKACLRADSASLLADLQQHSGAADMQVQFEHTMTCGALPARDMQCGMY